MAAPARHHPLPTLRASLAASRARGEDFPVAWARALGRRSGAGAEVDWPGDTETRRLWRDAIEATAPAWRRCYLELEPTRGERAVVLLASMLDDEPLFGTPEPPAAAPGPFPRADPAPRAA